MIRTINKLFALALLCMVATSAMAQAPAGYYKSAEGKNQKALLQELCDIVGPHTNVGYDGLWKVYADSDIRPGTRYYWDMYSTANFTSGDKCGNYKYVGDCVNREHSFPKSWFDDRQPMMSDAFHIYPTDGKVNGQRSNYPFGECERGTTLPSHNGVQALGRLGSSTFPGYSGTVFEPVDEYKGDFARTYFYMAACYNDKIGGWNSPMLARNSYPCYTTWAINLLMKWHEQDPVSQKEIDRNNAVYKHQRNRNPFIDHPELADYIWGDRKNQGWVPGGVIDPEIVRPYNNSSIDFGTIATGRSITKSIDVKANGLTQPLSVSVTGNGFSTTATTISANMANEGTKLSIVYTSATPADAVGTLVLSSTEAKSTVSLTAKAVDGIPALPATNVTMDSFTANWTDIDNDGGNYTLSVYLSDGKTMLPGYPKEVAAATEKHTVAGLDYAATYQYKLANKAGKQSNVITVTTAEPDRMITFELPTEGLNFNAAPETESAPKAVTVHSKYIEESTISVSISGIFQISTDKKQWVNTLTLDTKDTEAIGAAVYVRMPKSGAGQFSGTLSASTPTVEGESVDISGSVAAPVTFFEDFEKPTEINSYDGGEYQGTACRWMLANANIWGRPADKFNGEQAFCSGKTGEASLTMLEDKQDGAGKISFLAAPYGTDGQANATLSYSTDGGAHWTKVQDYVITSSALTECSAQINISSPIRFKIEQTAGKRLNIDDVKITAYYSGVESQSISKSWDAYCRDSRLIVETSAPATVYIYTTDARLTTVLDVTSETSLDLPEGYYIVVNGNDSRKVIVR